MTYESHLMSSDGYFNEKKLFYLLPGTGRQLEVAETIGSSNVVLLFSISSVFITSIIIQVGVYKLKYNCKTIL